MTECNCDMIPVYIIAILGGLLIGVAINSLSTNDTVNYWFESFQNDVWDAVHQPQNILTNPLLYVLVILVGLAYRERIINIPFNIYYYFKDRKSIEQQYKPEVEQ